MEKNDPGNAQKEGGLDLVWGAANIGRVLNLDTRQTFYALETGKLPARKVGGKWVAERGQLSEFFLECAGG